VHRSVHLHLLGRSRNATSQPWRWGEAPKFPDYADRFAWAAAFEQLTIEECNRIVARTSLLLATKYGINE
jgi:hypothetical protein